MKKCLHCGKEFTGKSEAKEKTMKFCSVKCKVTYWSKKQCKEYKTNPDKAKKRREHFQKWVEKNRAHFNELMRIGWHRRKETKG